MRNDHIVSGSYNLCQCWLHAQSQASHHIKKDTYGSRARDCNSKVSLRCRRVSELQLHFVPTDPSCTSFVPSMTGWPVVRTAPT